MMLLLRESLYGRSRRTRRRRREAERQRGGERTAQEESRLPGAL